MKVINSFVPYAHPKVFCFQVVEKECIGNEWCNWSSFQQFDFVNVRFNWWKTFIVIISNTIIDGNFIACFICVMGVLSNKWCIENFSDYWTDLWKPFHEANILMVLILYGNLSIEDIRDTPAERFLIHEIYGQGTKLVKLICCSFDFHNLRRWFWSKSK